MAQCHMEYPTEKVERKWYLSFAQLCQGLRKRPTWYGGGKSGSYFSTPQEPKKPYYRLVGGTVVQIPA